MKPNETDLLADLPCEESIRQGLSDWHAGRTTIESCLVAMSSPRLRQAGMLSTSGPAGLEEPERELYRRLRSAGGDAYSRYNALIRELVSFGQALDRRLRVVRARG